MSRTEMVLGLLGALVILLIYLWFLVALHMAYTKADEILSHLKNSRAIRGADFYRNLGPWGMLRLIGAISSCVAFPRKNIKLGNLNVEDMQSLPAPLKRKLTFLYKSLLTLLGLLFLVAASVKIIGWIK